MSDKSERVQKEFQNMPFPSKRPLFFHCPGILAGLIIFIGGCTTFIIWTFPRMALLSSSNRTFMTYAIVFAPTLFTILVIALAFLVWWALAGYNRGGITTYQKRGRELITPYEDREKQQKYPSRETSAEIAPPRRALARHSTTASLQQKRKRKFYEGRHYKGKIHQTDIKKITTPLSPSSLPFPTREEANAPISTSQEINLDQRDVPFLRSSATVRSSSSDHSLITQTESAPPSPSPSYETMEIPVQRLQPPVSIYLLKEITVEVQNQQGIKRAVQLSRKRREDGKYTERELLAYLASWRGQPTPRDRLLESVFAYGLSDEKYSLINLTNQFNKCTQFLRQDINKIASALDIPTLTIISSTRDEWRLLAEECRVVDLDTVEEQYSVIAGISGNDCLKPAVQEACQIFIDIYRGDFLEDYVETIVREGGDAWVDNWIRTPYTTYRTKYFQALWYRAEFWRIRGDLGSDASEAERLLQRDWYEMAAKLYREYALRTTTSFTQESAMLFDLDIKQRLSLGERALRASLDMYAATKNTQAGDALYLTFAQRMDTLTQGQWRPRSETIEAWTKLKEQTKSHRFAPQVTPHDQLEEGE